MSKPKRIFKKIRIGLSQQGIKMLNDLASIAGETYQGLVLSLIKKEWKNNFGRTIPTTIEDSEENEEGEETDSREESFNERLNRIVGSVPQKEHNVNGKVIWSHPKERQLKWAEKMEEKYHDIIPPPESKEESEEQEDVPVKSIPKVIGTPVKRIKAFTWELSSHPQYKSQKLFGKIIVVEPHKMAELSRSKTTRILRTKEEVEQASKEVIEIGEWQAKKEEEYHKKYPDEKKFSTEWGKIINTFKG